MTNQTIEQEIQANGLTAPRVTLDDIEANIVGEHYFTAADGAFSADDGVHAAVANRRNIPASLNLLTFCVLVLRNGFTVTGESACVSTENFNAEIGRKIARQNAVKKIWPLMGYELRSNLAWRESHIKGHMIGPGEPTFDCDNFGVANLDGDVKIR